MVAYLEKTEGNTDFHEIIDLLRRSSIHYALTVSPVVSITFVEQFWMSAKSKIINNVRYITAKVVGKPVNISEASIRIFLVKQLKNVPVPLDHFHINALTSKVFSFMVKKGKHFSGNVTPLFESMLVQPTEDKGPSPNILFLIHSKRVMVGIMEVSHPSDRSFRIMSWPDLQSEYDLCVSYVNSHKLGCKSVSMKQDWRKKFINEKVDAKGDLIGARATSIRSVLTLKHLPKIDPKDKGKKVTLRKKLSQMLSQRELMKLKEILHDIQARIEADRLLAARLQEEERETFTVEDESKFLLILLLRKGGSLLNTKSCFN
ncbi:hypothetical protein Tco_0017505 [Tanacetum coccineum]